jgi:hypothetical protein
MILRAIAMAQSSEDGRKGDANQVLQFGLGQWKVTATLDAQATALWGIPNVPAGDYLPAWGFGPNDVWLGNGAGQLVHYDGATWKAITASPSGSAIGRLWGAAGQVYFNTNIEFGRWNGQSVDVLIGPQSGAASNPRVLIRGLWGPSATGATLRIS